MKLMFLGAPGAGKGTQAEIVSEKYSIPAISTGALLREAMANGTELGTLAKKYVDSGSLVPDEVIIGLVKERLAEKDCANGYILDGFPRNVSQAEALDQMGIKLDLVIDIHVSDERIVKSMSGRRVCKDCGRSYHTESSPSKVEGVCDVCNGELLFRKDDDPVVVKHRLEVYHEQTEPLINYYSKKGVLVTVEGQEEKAETTKLTLAEIDKVRNK